VISADGARRRDAHLRENDLAAAWKLQQRAVPSVGKIRAENRVDDAAVDFV